MVRRDLHHEGRGGARKGDALEQEARDDGGEDADEVEGEDEVLAVGREERRGEEHVDRETGAAAHERSHHDRDDAVGGAVHRAGGHDGGHVAAEADEQRHEGLTRQAEGAHQAVHDECGAGHVAGVLENGEEEEEEEDDRDEGCDRLDAAADAVGEHDAQPVGRAEGFEQGAEAVDEDAAHENVEEVDEGRPEILREEEHQVHHEEEDRQAEPAVEHDAVDPVRERLAGLALADDGVGGDRADEFVAGARDGDVKVSVEVGGDGLHDRLGALEHAVGELFLDAGSGFHHLEGKPARTGDAARLELGLELVDAGGDALVEADLHRRDDGVGEELADAVLELADARGAGGDDAHDGAAEGLLKLVEADFDLVLLRDVEHVDDDEHRHAHLDELCGEVEVALEVGGVDDVDDAFRLAREDVVASDALILARCGGRRDGVDAGKVGDLDFLAAPGVGARLLLDGHAGPVAHVLLGARERIEERRLAAVRIADNADGFFRHDVRLNGWKVNAVGVNQSTETSMMAASSRRTLIMLPRTRISTGSPRGAMRTTSNSAPGVAPSIRRRRRYSGCSFLRATILPRAPGESSLRSMRVDPFSD